MNRNNIIQAVNYDQLAGWVKNILAFYNELDKSDTDLKLHICSEIERRVDSKLFITVAIFSDLWQSLMLVGIFDAVLLKKAAEKYNIFEDFAHWDKINEDVADRPLHKEYRLFLKEALRLARKELISQSKVSQS